MNNTYKTNKNGEGFFYVSPQYLQLASELSAENAQNVYVKASTLNAANNIIYRTLVDCKM